MAVTFLNTAVLQNIGRARHGECATPTDFYDVWRCVKAFHVAEEHSALEGVTQIAGVTSANISNMCLQNLPKSLQSLTFGWAFNESLEQVHLPNNLQSLTSGNGFNQSLEQVTLPTSLQSLTIGDGFNQSLEKVALPDNLQCLTFGRCFNQSLELVSLPSSMQSLTMSPNFTYNRSIEGAKLPRSLHSLALCSILVSTV